MASERPQPPIDAAAFQQRLDRISEIFDGMMATVEDLTTKRCPYKNRHDRCTAAFGCRNQRKPPGEGELMICGGDDKLDYRRAWDSG